MLEALKRTPNRLEVRAFALTMLLGMPGVGLVWTGLIWLTNGVLNFWIFIAFAGAGSLVCGLSLVSKRAGRACYILWCALGALVELVVRYLSTLIMYYLALVPIGLIMKAFGRKPLPVEFDRARKSYWNDRKEGTKLERYFRQY